MSSMIAAFSITPLGTGESVGELVAETVRIVRASGLPNETNAMFTNIEGGGMRSWPSSKNVSTRWRKPRPYFRRGEAGLSPGQTERPYESKGGVSRAPAVRELRSCWVSALTWPVRAGLTGVLSADGQVVEIGASVTAASERIAERCS